MAKSWIEEEIDRQEKQREKELGESLKIEANCVVELTPKLDVKPNEWFDDTNKCTKVKIPVLFEGREVTWWLNKRNPIYWEVINRYKEGQRVFKIVRTGKGKDTRYSILGDITNKKEGGVLSVQEEEV